MSAAPTTLESEPAGTPLPIDPDQARRDEKRLAAVISTGLLDSPPEEGFDRLTKLAAKLIGVPVTFITLVDQHRDYYKSAFGLEEKLAPSRELEGRTFCHYAISSATPLLIEDTLENEVFSQVPTVRSLGVRAYAGIPLVTDDGHAIGSFCAVDFAPRKWFPLDVDILVELAASALREIKLRAAVAEAQKQARLAQEATRSREEVLAIVAHDLRTPLNFIKMATELVADAPDSKENADLIERMHGAVDLMSLLIADLLEVAKIEAGTMRIDPQPTAVHTLVDDALAMLKPLARRRDITLRASVPAHLPDVMADYERILRVFSNLVVNAMKFSRAGTKVCVTAEQVGDKVRFSVIDNGSGIPADQLSRIFDRFWQLNSADARGVGLGLAIVKSIVTGHGGTIGVESKVGEGSDFHFDLPIANVQPAAA
jgi:signal transduction histidine kinase